jgi:hypothetical protein
MHQTKNIALDEASRGSAQKKNQRPASLQNKTSNTR